MSVVNFTGASSGIDWASIIDAQIQARRTQLIAPMQKWQNSWETKAQVFDQLRALLAGLQTTAKAMDETSKLQTWTAESSDSAIVGAGVSGTTSPGSYSIDVHQLAEAEVECHAGLDSPDTVVNNTGASQYFKYTYAGTTVTVEVESGMTLTGLRDLINHDSNNPGVVASLLSDGGSGFNSSHLVLRGKDTGSAYGITIDAAGTTLAGDWSALTADAPAGSSSVTVADATAFQRYQAIQIGDDDTPTEYHVIDSVSTSTLNLRSALAPKPWCALGADFTTAQNAFATPRGIGSGLSAVATAGQSQIAVADAGHFQVGKHVIVADGSNYEELTISSVDTSANTITVSSNLANSYTADGYVTQLEGGRKFSFSDTEFTQIQAGQNAQFRVDGYPPAGWLERAANTITDAIDGITLTLKNVTGASAPEPWCASPAVISVNSNSDAVKDKVQTFVEAYNKVKTFLNEEQSYDPAKKRAGELLGNYAAEMIETELRAIINGAAPGFLEGADAYTMLAQIGIETYVEGDDKTAYGTLTFDETQFDKAMADNSEDVLRVLSESFKGFSDSSFLTFHQASSLLTTPGTYDVKVDFDASGNITAGWIKLSRESTYRSAAINGSYIVGTAGKPEDSLWVNAVWDGSSTSQTASVRVTQGITGALVSSLDKVLDSTDGLIKNIGDSYEEIVDQLASRIDAEEARLDALRARLTERYARLEQLMSQLQGMSSWASSLATSLESYNV